MTETPPDENQSATDTTTAPTGSISAESSAQKPAKAYSCLRCFERKVKCDRQSPCNNCSRLNAQCIFRVPPPPRRRKKRTQEEILKARLDHYESILRGRGIDVEGQGPGKGAAAITGGMGAAGAISPGSATIPRQGENSQGSVSGSVNDRLTPSTTRSSETLPRSLSVSQPSSPPMRQFSRGGDQMLSPKLIVDQGRSRFVENNLWTTVSEELRKPSDAMAESSDEEDDAQMYGGGEDADFVFGPTPSSNTISDLHPLPEQILPLWQTFLENVNPLSKLVHPPSLQPVIFDASGHLDKLPKSLEALMFAIYSTAVMSMEPSECRSMMGETQAVLLARYRAGTKRALARAKLLSTSDLMVLQAFVLHLLSMRDIYDSRTLWVLTGVGNRIGEGMGVHRDGYGLGLGPFETEMRRRLWWQLTFLDFRTAEMTGSGNHGNVGIWDMGLPTNVNDADIWPGMTEPPKGEERATDMVFCLTRYELGNFWKQKMLAKNPNSDFNSNWSHFRLHSSLEEKDAAIGELEQLLQDKYVRFCDPSVPVEFMSILVTRAATNGMRLMTHHPRRYERDEDVPESERKFLWSTSMKLLEIDNLLHASKPMHRFLWHTNNYFQWQALIYVLGELRKNPTADTADRGWSQVNQVFNNHPAFVSESRKPINFAVGSLVLKAWDARLETWGTRSFPWALQTPTYIETLRSQREEAKPAANALSAIPMQQKFTEMALDATVPATNVYSTPITQPLAQPDKSVQRNLMSAQQPLPTDFQPDALFPMEMQQPQYFWWDYNNLVQQNQNVTVTAPEIDFADTLRPDQDNMDWSRWDFLLKEYRPTG